MRMRDIIVDDFVWRHLCSAMRTISVFLQSGDFLAPDDKSFFSRLLDMTGDENVTSFAIGDICLLYTSRCV